MENSRLVAVGGAGKGLEAVERDGGNESVVLVGERDVAGHLGADGLRVVVVEDQAVDVAGEIFDDAGNAGVRRVRSLRPRATTSTPPWLTSS